jgi:monofunctional biosynthetic peptidoglycan transglycosylase
VYNFAAVKTPKFTLPTQVTPKRIAVAGAALFAAWAAYVAVSLLFLPPVDVLRNSRTSLTITVRDWQGKERPFVVGPKSRYWTPSGAIPVLMKRAVVASEDANFYVHEGVDFEAMKDAMREDLKKGRFVRGGSTITQQLAKNLFLSREKTITRKVKEIVLARRMDDVLTKDRLLELYLNVVELGPMVYGIGHGSRYYFGKPPSALTARECAFFAAMLPGPRVYNPYRKMDKVVRRSTRILRRMRAAGMIGEPEYQAAMQETPALLGLQRRVERTLAEPLPPEAPPESAVAVLPGGDEGGKGGGEEAIAPGTAAPRAPVSGGDAPPSPSPPVEGAPLPSHAPPGAPRGTP